MSPAGARPLEGVRVLDFTWAAAGPVATTFMAFLGADVVKVEVRTRPDLMRVATRQYGFGYDDDLDSSPSFNELAAMKRSIELDLTVEADRQVARRLADSADVVVENMRPGKIEAFALGYEDLRRTNPGLVMCSVSATARTGDPVPIPGYAPIFWAEAGGAWMTGWPDHAPGVVRGPVDFHAAAFGCLGVLALLHRRAATGEGGYIDCSAIETVSAVLGETVLEAAMTNTEPQRRGNEWIAAAVNDVFPCRGDDQWIAVTIVTPVEWQRFCSVIGWVDGVPPLPLGADRESLWSRIAGYTVRCDGPALEAELAAQEIPAAVSLSLLRALDDPGLAARGLFQTVHHDRIGDQRIVGLPWTVDGRPYAVERPSPRLGGDRDAVLAEWLGEDGSCS